MFAVAHSTPFQSSLVAFPVALRGMAKGPATKRDGWDNASAVFDFVRTYGTPTVLKCMELGSIHVITTINYTYTCRIM